MFSTSLFETVCHNRETQDLVARKDPRAREIRPTYKGESERKERVGEKDRPDQKDRAERKEEREDRC